MFLSNLKSWIIFFQNFEILVRFKSKNSKIVSTIYALDPLFVLKSTIVFQLPPSRQRASFIRSVNGFLFDRQVVATYGASRSNIKSHMEFDAFCFENERIKLRNRYNQIYFFNFSPGFGRFKIVLVTNVNSLCNKNHST